MPSLLLAASLLLLQGSGIRQPAGSQGPPLTGTHEPTSFERFVDKLALDDKQLPDTGKIFSAAAAPGTAIGRDMIAARLRLVDVDGKPEAAPVMDALNAAALKLTALDAKTFQQVYALLEKGQQKSAPEGFVLSAGLLDMSTPRAAGGRRAGPNDPRPTRLDLIVALFTLTGDQKKQVKTILDADHKAAASMRDQWTASRTAVGKAIQSGVQADVDAAVTKHAPDAAQMAAAEARALAKIIAVLTPEQKANTAAIQTSVFHLRLVFAGKKWDVSPE